MAVSRLITLFESLEPTTTPKTRRVGSPAPSTSSPSPLSFLHTDQLEVNAATSVALTPSSSAMSSPSSSFRTSKRYSRSYSPCSPPPSRYLFRRQPSAVDIALQDERNSTGAIGLGLMLMEPRPVLEVPISAAAGHVFDRHEYDEDRQPFFMGGILEVMEGTS